MLVFVVNELGLTVPSKPMIGNLLAQLRDVEAGRVYQELEDAGFRLVGELANPSAHSSEDAHGSFGLRRCEDTLHAFARALRWFYAKYEPFENVSEEEIEVLVSDIGSLVSPPARVTLPSDRQHLRELRRPRERVLLSCGGNLFFLSCDRERGLRIEPAVADIDTGRLGSSDQGIGISSGGRLVVAFQDDNALLVRLGVERGLPAERERLLARAPCDGRVLAVEASGSFAARVLVTLDDATELHRLPARDGSADGPLITRRSDAGLVVGDRAALVVAGRWYDGPNVATTGPLVGMLPGLHEIISVDQAVIGRRQITAAIGLTTEGRVRAVVAGEHGVLFEEQVGPGAYQIDIARHLDAQRAPITLALTTDEVVQMRKLPG